MIELSKHISIVIPTYNEEVSIGNLLSTFYGEDYMRKDQGYWK